MVPAGKKDISESFWPPSLKPASTIFRDAPMNILGDISPLARTFKPLTNLKIFLRISMAKRRKTARAGLRESPETFRNIK